MNSEYGQSSSRENSVEQRKPMEELKRMNQPSSALANAPPQMMQPIVIQCDLPQTMNKLAKQVGEINWALEEIRNTLPELKTRIDLTPVQKSLTEMQRSLTEMNKLLERVGNLSERYSSKWIDWLPDFSLLVALKWIMLVLILGMAALAGWYGAAAIRSLFP
jgi:arginyl-tRNA synthetase